MFRKCVAGGCRNKNSKFEHKMTVVPMLALWCTSMRHCPTMCGRKRTKHLNTATLKTSRRHSNNCGPRSCH